MCSSTGLQVSQTTVWRCASERASKNSTLHFTESLKPNTSLLVQKLHTIPPWLAYHCAPLPGCPHSAYLTQSGLSAKADRLLQGKPASIWNITGSKVQPQPAPVAVTPLFHWNSLGFIGVSMARQTHLRPGKLAISTGFVYLGLFIIQ